jgi:hypothetical protein
MGERRIVRSLRKYLAPMATLVEWLRANTNGRLRRILIGGVGGSMTLAGIALLVLPGPGIPLVLAGLGVLSLEFAIARTWVDVLKRRAEGVGVPKQALWILPIAGIIISIAFTLTPAFVAVVHGNSTWTVVRKPAFSWAHSYSSIDELRNAAADDHAAAEILARSGLDRSGLDVSKP